MSKFVALWTAFIKLLFICSLDCEYWGFLKKKQKKEKKSKNVYYTVHLNDIYNSYDDKTVSEDDMIEAIKKETTL